MAYSAKVLEIIIASPSDVPTERQIVRDVIREWNNIYARDRKIVLLATGWETHSSPSLSGRPQQLINDRLLVHADVLVGIFWTRVGSSTGKAISGTIEEIEEHRKLGKPVMLYFSDAPISMKSVDADQYRKLTEFKGWAMSQGLIESFTSHDDFREKFRQHLPNEMQQNQYIQGLIGVQDVVDISFIDETKSSCSLDGREILKAAAATKDGMIIVSRLLGGTRILAGSQEFGDGGQRAAARWEAAVEEIRDLGFAKIRSNPDVFYLTDKGYQYLEQA